MTIEGLSDKCGRRVKNVLICSEEVDLYKRFRFKQAKELLQGDGVNGVAYHQARVTALDSGVAYGNPRAVTNEHN
jgi:hypothetical protein